MLSAHSVHLLSYCGVGIERALTSDLAIKEELRTYEAAPRKVSCTFLLIGDATPWTIETDLPRDKASSPSTPALALTLPIGGAKIRPVSTSQPHDGESIGERLLRLRLERGFSQGQLGGKSLSGAHISRIETGKRSPSLRAIRLLARKLRVSPEYLETGEHVGPSELLELRLSEIEVQLRLGEQSAAALEALQLVYFEARRAGDEAIEARAQIALGLAQASQGRYREAATHLEQAIKSEYVHPATHPDVFVTLGRMFWLLDDYERFAEVLENALVRLEEQSREETVVARTTLTVYLSYALSCLGDFDRARELLMRVAEDEKQRADPYARARLYWSLARLSSMEGKPRAALKQARRSIVLLESTEDDVHLAEAYLLCGQIFNLDERPDEASRHLTLAEEFFGPRIEPINLGRVRAEQAKSLAGLGQAEEALAYAEQAARLLEDDPDFLASAWHALAWAHGLQGHVETSCSYYERAVDRMAWSRETWRDAVQACHGWAHVLKEAGRRDEAAHALGRAAEIARRGKARRISAEAKGDRR
jgi:tetratricopeptide (TPR) repeat protein